MEYNVLTFLLCVGLLGLCSGLTVEMQDGANKMEMAGANTSLTCTLNTGLEIILTHTIQWVHVPIDDPEQQMPDKRREIVLTNQQTRTENASPDFYDIDVDYNKTHITFTLTFKKLRPTDDGIYLCRVTRNSDNLIQKASADIIVVNDVEEIAMQFDGEEAIKETSDVVLQREEGKYGVTCTAIGFSPDATIQLFLGEEELETGGTQILPDWVRSKAAGARRFSASATTSRLDLRGEHSGHVLKCSAVAGFQKAMPVMASVPLSIIIVEPEISCEQNVSAKVGDAFVKISCDVHHANVNIERYIWEIGKNGMQIIPNVQNEKFHEVHVERVDEHNSIVTLDLFEVDGSYFDTYFYLVVYTPSGVYREKAALVKLEGGDPSSSTKTRAVLLVFLLSALLSLWSSC